MTEQPTPDDALEAALAHVAEVTIDLAEYINGLDTPVLLAEARCLLTNLDANLQAATGGATFHPLGIMLSTLAQMFARFDLTAAKVDDPRPIRAGWRIGWRDGVAQAIGDLRRYANDPGVVGLPWFKADLEWAAAKIEGSWVGSRT